MHVTKNLKTWARWDMWLPHVLKICLIFLHFAVFLNDFCLSNLSIKGKSDLYRLWHRIKPIQDSCQLTPHSGILSFAGLVYMSTSLSHRGDEWRSVGSSTRIAEVQKALRGQECEQTSENQLCTTRPHSVWQPTSRGLWGICTTSPIHPSVCSAIPILGSMLLPENTYLPSCALTY